MIRPISRLRSTFAQNLPAPNSSTLLGSDGAAVQVLSRVSREGGGALSLGPEFELGLIRISLVFKALW